MDSEFRRRELLRYLEGKGITSKNMVNTALKLFVPHPGVETKEELSLHRGMRVRHALTLEQIRMVESGRAEVRNSYGHVVGLDGALSDGQRLSLHRKNR